MSISREEIEDYYRSFRPALLRNLRFIACGVRLPDDIVQDVFATLLKRAHELTFESRQHAFNWINQRARRDAKSHNLVSCSRAATLEREQHMVPSQLQIQGTAPASQYASLLASEVMSYAASAERKVVFAAFCEEVPLREIAPEAGVSYEAVRLRLNRFRARVPDGLLKGEERVRRIDPAQYKKLTEQRYARKRKRYEQKVGGLQRKKRK